MNISNSEWIDEIKFNEAGLIPAIAQDHATKRVLMVAWMNREAIIETVTSEIVTYFSRSRNALWTKGEQSGHVQQLKAVQLDCDSDVLTLFVEQAGDIACHTGRNSCFFRVLTADGWQETEPVLKDPKEIYPNG